MTGDERLKKAFAVRDGKAVPAAECPGDEAIWAAARGELPTDRVQEILAHSLDCANCEESFRMAAGMMAERRAATAGAQDAVGAAWAPAAPSSTGTKSAPAKVLPFLLRRRLVFALGAVAAAILVMIALPTLLRRGGAPPSPASLDATVATTMWRVSADGDEPLTEGDTIRPGDRLYMTLESDEPVHLYVINRDDAGEASVLFPIEGAQWSNPLQPGIARRIPGETSWAYDSWEVSSAGGRDAFIVVAAREPIPRLQSALDRIAAATPLGTDESLRGGDAGSADEAPDSLQNQLALDRLLRDLAASSESGEADLVMRRIVLENPR